MGRAFEAVNVKGKRIDLRLQRSKRTKLRLDRYKDGMKVHGVRIGLTMSRWLRAGLGCGLCRDGLLIVAPFLGGGGREVDMVGGGGRDRSWYRDRGPPARGRGPRERSW